MSCFSTLLAHPDLKQELEGDFLYKDKNKCMNEIQRNQQSIGQTHLPMLLNHRVNDTVIRNGCLNWLLGLHQTLLVLVVLCPVLRQTRLRPANFSTDVARPWDALDVGLRVSLQVCLRKSNKPWIGMILYNLGLRVCSLFSADHTTPDLALLVDHRVTVGVVAVSHCSSLKVEYDQ